MQLIFASKNRGKIKEVRNILAPEIELISLNDLTSIPEIEENGTSFEENARIKAETVFHITSIPSIGDDSGLEVAQLDGRPGVYSARYAGLSATDEENNNKLLYELSKFPEPHYARFVCTAAYFDGERFEITSGEINGTIIKEPRGDNGFGYDPLFLPVNYKVTSGEISLEEKNMISHRAIAFRKMKSILLRKI